MFQIIFLLFFEHRACAKDLQKIVQKNAAEHLVVWNVGQGQWVTIVSEKVCKHFDVGGEYKPSPRKLREFCGGKENLVFFSHWDWDHIGLIRFLSSNVSRTCIAQMPGGDGNDAKVRLLKSFYSCAQKISTVQMLIARDGKTANANSNVFVTDNVLIPGDSPTSQEKLWLRDLLKPSRIRTLILGHHGSRTSTGNHLLDHLPNLKVAIASARKPRYGHPHPHILFKLQQYGVPVLKTEDWGSLILSLHP